MATTKWANDAVMDAGLAEVATSAMLRVCSGTSSPADRAAAVTATLASVALTPGDGGGDFTITDGGSGGRQVTISQQSDISITVSGSATCVALDDGTALQYVTTCTEQALTSGGTVTVPAWTVTIGDPA